MVKNAPIIYDDLISPANHEIDIIIHQCNSFGVMGAGIAKQIASKYPEVAEKEKDFCKNPKYAFGKNCIVNTNDGRVVINMHSQFRYGTKQRQTNYDALRNCLQLLLRYYLPHQSQNAVIGLPYKIGCGLGGGDWETVNSIIQDFAVKAKQPVFIVKK